MGVHSDLKKHLDSFPGGLTWVEGTRNATVAAANNTLSAQRLAELERVAISLGYEVVNAAGVLTIQPKAG
jgi:hypothetical protein